MCELNHEGFLFGLEPYINSESSKLCTRYYKSCIESYDRINSLNYTNKNNAHLNIEDRQAFLCKKYCYEQNYVGRAFNYYFFNKCLCENKDSDINHIKKELLYRIVNNYSSKGLLIEYLKAEAKKLKGRNGWVWIIKTKDNRIMITHTKENENPLMVDVKNIKHGKPLLCLCLCDHVYFHQYGNTSDYIENIRNIINWKFVQERFSEV